MYEKFAILAFTFIATVEAIPYYGDEYGQETNPDKP